MALFKAIVILAIATGYAPAAGGVNCNADCGVTAFGFQPGPAVAACGSAYAPGDVLHVDGYGVVVCADRFGAQVSPTQVDLWFATSEQAIEWGRRQVLVNKFAHFDIWR